MTVGYQASNTTVIFLISLWENMNLLFFNLLETPTVTLLSLSDSNVRASRSVRTRIKESDSSQGDWCSQTNHAARKRNSNSIYETVFGTVATQLR